MLDAIESCGVEIIRKLRSSQTVAVRFAETESGPRILGNMLSISILEFLVTLVGCIICGKDI